MTSLQRRLQQVWGRLCSPVSPPLADSPSLPFWQCFPLRCSGQRQCGPFGIFTHVPPFWQGLCLLQWSEKWNGEPGSQWGPSPYLSLLVIGH